LAGVIAGGGREPYIHSQRSRFRTERIADVVPHRPPVVGSAGLGGHRPGRAGCHGRPGRRNMRGNPRPAGPVLSTPAPVMHPASYDERNELCGGIPKSFVHLETRDSYGTEVELPHMAKWRRGEPDDFAWLGWWLEMLRGHRAAGRTCRRVRIVSEPVSDYQRWTMSHAEGLIDAG